LFNVPIYLPMSDPPISLSWHYHERTKYDPETIARQGNDLDWDSQPDPFKTYKLGKTIDLAAELRSPASDRLGRLSRLLRLTYGLTAKIRTLSAPMFLRTAPSAGGLYPAEVYLVSRGLPELTAGLYHYQPQPHSLLRFWDGDVWGELQKSTFWHPALEDTQLAIVVTAIFWRSAWRYRDRAYRRINLDIGHLLGNIELASSVHDYRAHFIGGFADNSADALLYLDPDVEGTMAIVPLADLNDIQQHISPGPSALASDTQTDYRDIPDGQLLAALHQATQIDTDTEALQPNSEAAVEDKYNFPFCSKIGTSSRPIDWGENLSGLEIAILKRRSTRAYSGASLSLAELNFLLDFTYQPQHYVEQGLDNAPDYFDLSLVETFIAVSAVEGLDDGCYYYAPYSQELRQVRFKNFRRELHFLCLGQDLGRDAAAVVFHTADLAKAGEKWGDRAYRYLHLDAGHLGQRLNLAAMRLELGASGIGGFFDNYVNQVLGIPDDEAVLYATTLGRPRSY